MVEGFWRARAMSSRVGRVVSSLGEGGLDIGTRREDRVSFCVGIGGYWGVENT